MDCSICGQHAVIDRLCADHFTASFEQRVRDTILHHDLIRPDDRIAVAVSGGKDSLTVLTLLKRWYGDVTAIAIDEGIEGYREQTLEDARRVCTSLGIPLVIRTYEELTGMTLDQMLRKKSFHPCTVCGTLRRHLLNVASKEFTVLATGHNADDEAQAILMNMIKGNTELFPRLGPLSGHGASGFTRRVKPLYFCTEKEVMTYAFLKGLVQGFTECPNVEQSYRHLIRDALNAYAAKHPGVRQRVLSRYLRVKESFPSTHVEMIRCETCGEPSSKPVCKACTYIGMLAKP